MSSPSKPHILEHPVSSYAQKVKIALREKGVDFTSELPTDISLTTGGRLHDTNPRVEVPVLLHNGNTIFDSTIILEYIEDVWPEPALLPKDAGQRAQARMIEDVCDTSYEALNWGLGELLMFGRGEGHGQLQAELETKAAQQTAALQEWLEERLVGPWFNGDAFGWADVCVAPIVNRSVYYGLPPKDGSKLKQWHQRLDERESVNKTFAEYRKGLEALKDPKAKQAYLSGARKREYRDHRLEWMIKSGALDIVTKGLENNNIRFTWP